MIEHLAEGPFGLHKIQLGSIAAEGIESALRIRHAPPYVYVVYDLPRCFPRSLQERACASALIQCESRRGEAAQWLLDYCNVRFGV